MIYVSTEYLLDSLRLLEQLGHCTRRIVYTASGLLLTLNSGGGGGGVNGFSFNSFSGIWVISKALLYIL